MIEIWDYFMRRKSLLLAVLATFFISSMISYRALHSNASEATPIYISVSSWGTEDDIEVPKTGGEADAQPFFAVISPAEVVQLCHTTVFESAITENPPYEIVASPAEVVNDHVPTESKNSAAERNLSSGILLVLDGIIVLALGGYFTYWHFRR